MTSYWFEFGYKDALAGVKARTELFTSSPNSKFEYIRGYERGLDSRVSLSGYNQREKNQP